MMIFNFLNINPTQTAFDLGDNQTITYGEFTERLQLFIDFLRSQPIQQGDCILLWLPQDINLVLAYYACLYLGIISVPVFAETTTEEFYKIQQLTGGNCILTCHEISNHIENDTEFQQHFQLINCDTTPSKTIGTNSLTDPDWPEQMHAQLFLTSGSTGLPKAVTYTYKTLQWADMIYREALQLSANDFVATTLDMNGNAGFAMQILPFLNAGARVRLLPKRNGESVYKAIADGATFLVMIPWLGMELLDYAEHKPLTTNQIRYCLFGGDRIPDKIFTCFPRLFNIYPNQVMGMSETNVYAMNLTHAQTKPHSAGTIAPYTEVKVMTNDGLTFAANTTGEVMVKTPMCFDGYWQNPELSEQTLIDGWVKTGDLGYFDEQGCLYFAGRIKQIIIHCGDNIYPQEIEAACMQHPNIKSAIIIGIDNPEVGEDIAAAVTLHNPNQTLELTKLKIYLSDKLTAYKIPTKLHIFDQFPENKNGKVDRKALKKHFNR